MYVGVDSSALFPPSHSVTPCCHQEWDQPEYIPDPDADKPEDWDDDTDGEWEPPMIPNPEYKVWARTSHCSSDLLQ